jgi:P-type Ca2+ transporter type 2C
MAVKTTDKPPVQDAHSWHTIDARKTLEQLNVAPETGLTDADVTKRLEEYGRNELVEKPIKSPWAILWEQLTNPLVLLLIGAALLSGLLGKWDSVIAISAIVVLNAVLGVVQEYRAEQAMAALKKMSSPLVRVRRNGRTVDVESNQLVPGDIVLLEAGSVIPADGRLIENANLQVAEAALTGESQPVEKQVDSINDPKAPLGDRANMVYMGTSVTYGRGVALIVQTGMTTQLGRIADLIQSVEDEKTPLQRRLDELGKVLVGGAIAVMILAGIVGVIRGQPFITADPTQESLLLNAVAIAVAVVPEGLPAVVTIALALGAQRMLRRRALIRKLQAVETLGSVTVICSDKTGTLTENKMTLTILDVAGHQSSMADVAKVGIGTLAKADGTLPIHHAAQALVLSGSTLCNDIVLEREADGTLKAVGDPTEGALAIAAERFGMFKAMLEETFPRIAEAPFDSDRKRMSTIHKRVEDTSLSDEQKYLIHLLRMTGNEVIQFTKGAPDNLLTVSSKAWMDGKIVDVTPDIRQRLTKANEGMAQQGLRVLGLAFRHHTAVPTDMKAANIEQDLIYVGLMGIIDPPRKEVKDAVAVCKTAGIRPVMITGDHPLTAVAIAKELGIDTPRALTGHDLNNIDHAQLREVVKEVSVFARVSPENKLNIVKALQENGEVAAMTGDGVNDAPALKRSNIGVAMGITGTAVSKEASDMVILDDNFATIVSAVEEGRTIYDNVRRFVKYLLASNTGELFVLLATQLAGLSLPLTTLQILWMNLITDGIPALALGVEVAEKGGMNRPPYLPNESLFGRGLGRHIVIVGLIMGITGLSLGLWAHRQWQLGVPTYNDNTWNTMVFIFLTIAQMGHALGLRSHRETLFSMNPFSNRLLIGAVIVTLLLQMMAIYLPFFNTLFNTTPLTAEQLTICLVLSTVVFIAVELEKLAMRQGWLKA